MRRARGRRWGPGGFSVIEMVIVSFLTVLLSAIIGSVWNVFCFPALDVASRCQLTLEANLAAAALSRDCGGFLNTPDGRTLTLNDFRYKGCTFTDGQLLINFETPTLGNTIAVIYRLDGERLVRSVGPDGPWMTLASGLTAFSQAEPVDGDPGVAVRMTFHARGRKTRIDSPNQDLVATYILVTPAADPH
jgi:hypothetical protein